MPLASTNLGLQEVPDLTDILSVGKISFHLIQIYNALGVLQQALDNYTGNSPAPADNSNQSSPPENTVLIGNTANIWTTCGTTSINAGYLVYFTNNAGVTTSELANASNATKLALGIAMGSATTGNPLQVLLLGLFNFGGSVIPGQLYYLSDSTPGGLVTTPPIATGHIVQPVGYGVDTNSIFFNPCLNPKVN